MKFINEPADVDYLFISKQRPEETDNVSICACVRRAGTYSNYDYESPSIHSEHNFNKTLGEYNRKTGYDFIAILTQIMTLSKSLDMPVRYSLAMLVHEDELATAYMSIGKEINR